MSTRENIRLIARAPCAHECNLLSHMYNLILDFDKLPIFSMCMKINYINSPFIKLGFFLLSLLHRLCRVATLQLKFLVNGLRFTRFNFRTISLPNLSNRNQSLLKPGAMHESRLSDVHIKSVKRNPLHNNGVTPFTIHVINVIFRQSNN